MTPPAPEMGCPPASNMSEQLTARRAPLGHNEVEAAIPVSFFGLELAASARVTTGIANAVPPIRTSRRETRLAAGTASASGALMSSRLEWVWYSIESL